MTDLNLEEIERLAKEATDVLALVAEIKRLREALERISKFHITVKRGGVGEFIGAGAVEIARKALGE